MEETVKRTGSSEEGTRGAAEAEGTEAEGATNRGRGAPL